MTRTTAPRMKATVAFAIACTTALVFTVATVQARPTHSGAAHARGLRAVSELCTMVISGNCPHSGYAVESIAQATRTR